MAVRIRLKQMGRKHRPYYRVCAMDSRTPRGGKVLEELGSYDPMVSDTDARAVLNGERIDYWLGVGALPTDKVKVLIKKYGSSGTHLEQQKAALERMAQPKAIPDPGAPASLPKKKEPAPAAKQEAANGQPAAEAGDAKESAEAAVAAPADAPAAEADQGQAEQSEATEQSAPAAEAESSKPSEADEETKTKEDD